MRWGLVAKARIPHVRSEALWLKKRLEERGEEVRLEQDLARAEGVEGSSLDELDRDVDLFLTVGGDGTILLTQQHTQKPVFGVNAGAIGFLAEVEPPQAADAIDAIVAGDYRVEERSKLSAWLDGTEMGDATNEVTVQTRRIAKLIHFRIAVDGEHLDTLRGDGLIVSTPTGSTGYAMSVGGPLVHPAVRGVVLAPIAPFRLAARPWVIPEGAHVELVLLPRDSARSEKQAKAVLDGQRSFTLSAGDAVEVRPARRRARFVRLGAGFYERVRTKLVR